MPLLWAVLLLFHPGGDGTRMYADVHDKVTPWLVVHIGMMLFIPLMAAVVYLLLRGVEGTAARVSRIALLPFAVFYSTWEALQGIATGVLIYRVNELPAAERATGADLVQEFGENILVRDLGLLASIGSVSFLVAMIAGGIALHRHADAPLAVPVLLAIAGFLITAHPPPFGPTVWSSSSQRSSFSCAAERRCARRSRPCAPGPSRNATRLRLARRPTEPRKPRVCGAFSCAQAITSA